MSSVDYAVFVRKRNKKCCDAQHMILRRKFIRMTKERGFPGPATADATHLLPRRTP
jgi:hypothetical protein